MSHCKDLVISTIIENLQIYASIGCFYFLSFREYVGICAIVSAAYKYALVWVVVVYAIVGMVLEIRAIV